MADQLIPQKRVAEEEKHYQTRSATLSTAQDQKRLLLVNKFKPIVPYKPIDFSEFDPPCIKASYDERFEIIDEIPYNTRRGFQYHACSPNPILPVMKFGTTDLEPYSVALSYFDRSIGAVISKNHMSATTNEGWRSARTNIAIKEGKVYFEFNIINSNETSHVRVGLGRREASIEAPIGFDAYGYGLRDKTGQKVHLSRPSSFMDGFKTGDVLGILVGLPKQENFQDIVRDQIAIRYKHRLYYEKFDYVPTKSMDHLLNPVTVFGEKAVPDTNQFKPDSLPESFIKVYKNGEFVGTAFENLYSFAPPNSELKNNTNKYNNNGTLGYYPTVSCFKGGIVEINPGPAFKFKPSDLEQDVKELHELYNEKIATDIVWDLVDEIEAESLP